LPICDISVSLAGQTLFIFMATPITYWICVLETIGTGEQKQSGL